MFDVKLPKQKPTWVSKPVKHKVKIRISRDDSCTKGFGAYLVPSLTREGTAQVLLNIEAMFHAAATNDINAKEFLIETVMHEVGHAMEQYLKLRFSEKRVEGVVKKYRKRYGDLHNTKSLTKEKTE